MFSPLAEIKDHCLKNLRLIATDCDGTLTHQGKFTTPVIKALETLAQAEIPVIIVTGRSAGWVSAIATYLPVVGAIAENGGLYYASTDEDPQFLAAISDLNSHRQQLKDTFTALKKQFPQLQESADNRFRLTDWTFDVAGISNSQLQQLEKLCQDRGFGFTYSTVQCHIKPKAHNKASSLVKVLKQHFPQVTVQDLVTVGDSPNDQSLFDRDKFPLSVGVANIRHYSEQLHHQPVYVTSKEEGAGFAEFAELVINSRT